MTSKSKNVYIDKLDDIVNEYNNVYHRTVKMKPVNAKDNSYIDSTELHSNKEVNDKDGKFKVGDHVRISKKKKNLLKDTHKIDLKKFLQLKKLNIQFHAHMLLRVQMLKEILEHLKRNNYKKLINKNLG